MQFTVLINQARSLEWGLNPQQAILFSFLYEATAWADQVEKGGQFYWYMAKNKVITELPLLTDKPDTVYRLMKQLEKLGLITVTRAGHQLVYSLQEKAKSWNKTSKNSGNISENEGDKITEKNPKKGQISEENPPNSGKFSEKNTEKNPTYHITNKSTNQDHKSNTSGKPAGSPLDKNRYPDWFETLWKAYPPRIGSNGKKSAFNAASARLKEGHTVDELLQAVERYTLYLRATKNYGTQYVKQASTFFGPDEHIKNPWRYAGAKQSTTQSAPRIDDNDESWAYGSDTAGGGDNQPYLEPAQDDIYGLAVPLEDGRGHQELQATNVIEAERVED